MNLNRIWLLVTVLISIAVLALGWVLGISPKLAEAATAEVQRVLVDAQNQVHEQDLAKIKAQSEQMDDLQQQLAVLQQSMPPGDDLSQFVGQLHDLEAASGVVITSATISEAQPFTPDVAPTDGGAAIPPENFIAIPMSISITGDYASTMAFVEGLQTGERLFLVTTMTYTQKSAPVSEGESAEPTATNAETTVSGYIYVLLDPTAKSAESTEAPSSANG